MTGGVSPNVAILDYIFTSSISNKFLNQNSEKLPKFTHYQRQIRTNEKFKLQFWNICACDDILNFSL